MHIILASACKQDDDDQDRRADVDKDEANGETSQPFGRHAVQNSVLTKMMYGISTLVGWARGTHTMIRSVTKRPTILPEVTV